MRIIVKNTAPAEPEGERESLKKVTTGTLHWTPEGWDVGGEVKIYGPDFKTIPYRFHRVRGDFDISHNGMTSLKGSPRTVGGCFYAYSNKLTTLTGGPEEVGGDYCANGNRLISIEGISRKIGGKLFLSENPTLTSLKGFPEEVGGNLYLWGTSIFGMETIPGLMGKILQFAGWNDAPGHKDIWVYEGS